MQAENAREESKREQKQAYQDAKAHQNNHFWKRSASFHSY
jgi:hypothetical protein